MKPQSAGPYRFCCGAAIFVAVILLAVAAIPTFDVIKRHRERDAANRSGKIILTALLSHNYESATPMISPDALRSGSYSHWQADEKEKERTYGLPLLSDILLEWHFYTNNGHQMVDLYYSIDFKKSAGEPIDITLRKEQGRWLVTEIAWHSAA